MSKAGGRFDDYAADEEVDGELAELTDRLLHLIERMKSDPDVLFFLLECASAYEEQADPRELARRFIQEKAGEEKKRLSQLWMLFQRADQLYEDPEDLRQLLALESWARKQSVTREFREFLINSLRTLASAAKEPPSS